MRRNLMKMNEEYEAEADPELDQILSEFEDETVTCAWCDGQYPVGECRREANIGMLCSYCEQAIKSRGETLTFIEG